MRFFRTRTRRLLAGAALLLLLLGVAHVARPDPHLAKVRDLRQQLTGDAGRRLTEQQRREGWRQFREEMKRLSPQQRRALSAERRQRSVERLRRFAKMSKAERAAFLDAEINRMEALRRQRQGGVGGGRGGPGGAFGAGPGGGAAGRSGRSAEDRERWRKQRLDETTPEERALRAEFFKALSDRRQQRGVGGGRFGR
jgi:hypothetical protein